MKLIVHVTKDNLDIEQATELYAEIKEVLADNFHRSPSKNDVAPYLHVNGQVVDKFVGSHNTGIPEKGDI